MNRLVSYWRSSIGAKVTVAITGLMLFGFLVGHLAGNLLAFSGPKALNDYAYFLKSNPGILWGARIGLLGAFALHIATTVRLARMNRAARPVRYAFESTIQASKPSRFMVQTGLLVLAYVVYHLLHFTLGVTNPEHFDVQDAEGRHDVFRMLVLGFQNPAISITYIVAQVILFMHLAHGLQSTLQTVGFRHPRYTPLVEKLGPGIAAIVTLGFLSIPVAVWIGVIDLPSNAT